MLLTIIIVSSIFIAYVTFIYIKYGELRSISDSYYHLKPDHMGFLFYLFCLALASQVFRFYLFQDNILYVVAAFGFALTGSASPFYEKQTGLAHYVGAGTGIGFCLIAVSLDGSNYFPIPFFLVLTSLLWLIKAKNLIWKIELVAFVAIIIGFIKLLKA